MAPFERETKVTPSESKPSPTVAKASKSAAAARGRAGAGADSKPTTSAAVRAAVSAVATRFAIPAAFAAGVLLPFAFPLVGRFLPSSLVPSKSPTPPTPQNPYICSPNHVYTTSILSPSDPLLIALQGFVSPAEARAIIALGEPSLVASPVTGYGGVTGASDQHDSRKRTSSSAPLRYRDDEIAFEIDRAKDNATRIAEVIEGQRAVKCVLERAEAFMAGLPGTTAGAGSGGLAASGLLVPGRDDMGAPQMVRYASPPPDERGISADGQRYDLHRDWFAAPRILPEDRASGRRRMYNRVATFFVVLELEGNVQGGETWFPHVAVPERRNVGDTDAGKVRTLVQRRFRTCPCRANKLRKQQPLWSPHPSGKGIMVHPVPGNALFWPNLLANGSGDTLTEHAGLAVRGGGTKTGMNIWPRQFFGPDA